MGCVDLNWSGEALRIALHEAVRANVEGLMFSDAEIAPIDELSLGEGFLVFDLPVKSPCRGFFRLEASLAFARDFCATALVREASDVTTHQIQDAMQELLNSVTGRFLHDVVADHTAFELGLPTPALGEPQGIRQLGVGFVVNAEAFKISVWEETEPKR